MNNREIEEELESDDEYPSSYNESPTPPAYENDYRYDTIVFGWIDKMPKKSHTPTKMNQKHNKNPIQVVDQYDHRLDYIACGNTYKVPQRTCTQNKIDRDYNNRPSQPLYQNGRRVDHVVRNKVQRSYTP
ncbi:unnamed protein product [Leptosia nina]|uniref:Uncharacterized protein n=1 Tax=Leptosia nina TaxID=320188 RepID=A0AAV1IVP4_9NEOP